jgi:pimeloyl-ACP methyl ester carboxylesterase
MKKNKPQSSSQPSMKIKKQVGSGSARIEMRPFEAGAKDIGLGAVPSGVVSAAQIDAASPFAIDESGSNRFSIPVTNPADADMISAEQPLRLKADRNIKKSESLLVCYKDPTTGLYLPNGFGVAARGGAEISLTKIPDGAQPGTKDLLGAAQMLVFKFASKLGFENPYPLLRSANVNEKGEAQYNDDSVSQLKEKVKKAKRILLLVHGFTGDTRFMVVGQAVLTSQLNVAPYDLVLTYDYETINTTIQESALQLKNKLAEIGLVAGVDKTVHLMAHSLGTQVCRWFVEQLGGKDIVQRVVLLGSPNNGTSLAVLQKWLTYLVGLGLNGLLTVIAPGAVLAQLVHALSVLVGGVEKLDTTLDQLEPNSDFYKVLNISADPKIPYDIFIGNTKKITTQGQQAKLLQKLYPAFDVLFGGQPNDFVISVDSAQIIATLNRDPAPIVTVTQCDHISYLSTQTTLEAIAKALG